MPERSQNLNHGIEILSERIGLFGMITLAGLTELAQ